MSIESAVAGHQIKFQGDGIQLSRPLQNGIYAFEKAYVRSAPSLRIFLNVDVVIAAKYWSD